MTEPNGPPSRKQIVAGIANSFGREVAIIDNHWIARTLEGDYLRGIFVDRTSTPNAFHIYAFTQAWFSVADSFHLGFSFRLNEGVRFSGHASSIVQEIASICVIDKGVGRVVNAEPHDNLYLDTRVSRAGQDHEPVALRAEAAAMRALSGDHAWALPQLRRAESEYQSSNRPIDQWRKTMVSDLVRCLEEHGCVRSVLDPMAAAGRERVKVTRPAGAPR